MRVPDGEYIELSTYPGAGEGEEGPVIENSGFNFTDEQYRLIFHRLGVIGNEELVSEIGIEQVAILRETRYMLDKIDKLSIGDAIGILREAISEHLGDVNYPHDDYRLLERLIQLIPHDFDVGNDKKESNDTLEEPVQYDKKGKNHLRITDWNLQTRLEASLIAYHSPYPEIRSIVSPYDDPDTPVETVRVYVISLLWNLIGSIVNNTFVHRLPSISLGLHTVQLLLLPSGKLWEKCFPYNSKLKIFGKEYNLNPGPWTYKEMMLSTIIYSCSAGTPYLIYNIFVMKLDRFYGLKWVTWLFQILFALSTQFLGFAFAFIMLKVCIYPKKAIWPTILPTIALNRALMNDEPQSSGPRIPLIGKHVSRYSFFLYAFIASFIYNWFPSYVFTFLSDSNWPTFFSPNLIHLNNIAGFHHGLGLNPWPTFDWNIIDSASCLTIPFYTYVNQYLGTFLGFLVILIVYYTNNYWTAYFPINSNRLFNSKGEVYKVRDVLNDDNVFDHKKYLNVGPPYFSAANLVLYGAYFSLYPFAILYQIVTEWESMKQSFINIYDTIRDSFARDKYSHNNNNMGKFAKDPHCKMMMNYKEVPSWWFIMILIISTTFALICVSIYPTETPIWGVFFIICINFLFLIPITAIASVTGFTFGLNVLVELIVGYMIPNLGIALITLKSYGYNIDSQASNYITDQKLAHYTKIPPRAIFRGQLISTLISVLVALSIANWQINNVENICDLQQKDRLRCPGANTFFFSSLQFGEIGVATCFGKSYPILKWCFLLGVLLVIPCAWFKKNGPPNLTRYFHPLIIIGGFLLYAPYNLLYYTGGLYVSYLFKKRKLLSDEYNYILTLALSAGVAFSALIIFFTLSYNNQLLDWWGNNISSQGIEGASPAPAWLTIANAPDGYVGLRKNQY